MSLTPRSPDFVCIGAQKAGTWWLRENLRKDSRIWMPSVRELHYFDEPLGGSAFLSPLAHERAADDAWRNATLTELQRLAGGEDLTTAAWWAAYNFVDRSDHWYRSLFAFAPPGSLAGEITPRYMLCGLREIEHMYRVAPRAKILFLLRRPVERFWSQCKMKHLDGSLQQSDSAAMGLLDTSNGRPRGEYSRAIQRFARVFPPEQILLIFHEGIIEEPVAVMEAIYAFLGLPPAPLDTESLARPVNQSASSQPLSTQLRGRLEAAYRSEMEVMADVFGGHAAGWLGRPSAEPPSAALQLSAAHIAALDQRLAAAARRRKRPGQKVFCLSIQRSGTTSVGDWLEAHGLKRAGSPTAQRLGWSRLWLEGAYEEIFASEAFCEAEVLEDDPWWCPDFYRVIADRFPDATFILLERAPEAWFESMCHHSGGRNPGWSDVHARIYDREAELRRLLVQHPDLSPQALGLLSIVEHAEHYMRLYRQHGEAVRGFFRATPERLLYGRLDDPAVFPRICEFAGVHHNPSIPVPRSNARTDAMRHQLHRYLQEKGS